MRFEIRCALAAAAIAIPAIALPAAAQAPGQGIDLSRATCADFAGMNANDQQQMAVWLAGYFAGGAQRPQLDIEKISAAPAELATLCGKTPALPLIGAETRAVFTPAPNP